MALPEIAEFIQAEDGLGEIGKGKETWVYLVGLPIGGFLSLNKGKRYSPFGLVGLATKSCEIAGIEDLDKIVAIFS